MLVLLRVTVNLEFQAKHLIAKLFVKVHMKKGLKTPRKFIRLRNNKATDLKAIK